MSQIQINNLSFCYENSYDPVFSNVSVTLDDTWKLGIIGRNGRGKTTLLRLLAGEIHGTGNIISSTSFCRFPVLISDPSRSAYDVLMELGQDCVEWKLLRELSLLGFDEKALTRPYHTLSPGEQTKAQLAALFSREYALPLIDEPTNHLDQDGRKLILSYLQKKHGFILVSHDRTLLDGCVDHILSINRADITVEKGTFSSWQQNRALQDNFERAQNEQLRAEISRLNESVKRSSDWSNQLEKTKYATKNSGLRPDRGFIGHKSAKMMQRAKSTERRRQSAIEEKSKLLHNIERTDDLKLHALHFHSDRLFTFHAVAPCFNNIPVCAPISTEIMQGDRIALTGANGSGKSSLLRLLASEPQDYHGTFTSASNLKISYVSQHTNHLSGKLPAYAEKCGIDLSQFLTILRKLGFSHAQFEKDLTELSEGQRKKVFLARSLCQQAHIYLWDEPLNFIDVHSRIQIERLLSSFSPTMVFIEHDDTFCDAIATRSIQLLPVL